MKRIDLTKGPIDSQLRKFAAPLALSFLVHMLYAWVDLYYVSKVSVDAKAALGLSEQLYFFMFAVGSGFAFGTGIIVSRRVGEKKFEEANRTVTTAVITMLGVSITLSAILLPLLPTILGFLNPERRVVELATSYMSIVIFAAPFAFLMFQINAVVRSTGNSILPMIFLIASNVINLILTPLFVFGIWIFPEMGIRGAAVGTAVAQFTMAIAAFIALQRDVAAVKLALKNFKFNPIVVRRIFFLGIPASLQMMVVAANRGALMKICGLFGTDVLNTYIVGLRVDMFVFMSVFAVGAAMEIVTGQNLGAVKIDRIFKFHKSAIKQLSVLIAVLGTLVFFFGRDFAGLYIDSGEIIEQLRLLGHIESDLILSHLAEVIRIERINMVETYLRIMIFSYIPFAIGIVSVRIVSGSGSYFQSLAVVSIILLAVQLPAAFFLSRYTSLGYLGIWYGILISQLIFPVVALIFLHSKKWIKTLV